MLFYILSKKYEKEKNYKKIVEKIKNKVKFIAPVIAYPGEDEMIALAQGGLRVLNGEEKALDYEKEVLATNI